MFAPKSAQKHSSGPCMLWETGTLIQMQDELTKQGTDSETHRHRTQHGYQGGRDGGMN